MKLEHFEILPRDDGSLWELGRGAMGVTYKAWDTQLHCAVALKVIHPTMLDSETARERFLREARATAQLRHPNIATAHHLGKTEDDGLFYAMEFCDGPTLHQAVAQRGIFPAREALEVALQIARALVAAESRHIVHRDIKPSNLILTHNPDQGLVVKVIDFGLARSVVPSAALSYATIGGGGFMGTVHYASPEQLDEREVDIRSDFYSVGVCLWFMLSGKPVFDGAMARVMAQALSSEPDWNVLAGQPVGVVQLLHQLLAKDPADRPTSARLLRDAFESCLASLQVASPARKSTERIPQAALPQQRPPPKRPSRETAASMRRPVPKAAQHERILGHCEAIAEIERDALGLVLSGRDIRTGSPVRIRLCDAMVMAVPQIRRRYGELVQGLLDHPHPSLTEVLGCGEHAGEWAVISAPLVGVTAHDVLKARGRMSPAESLELLDAVAAALAHADAHGLASVEPQLQTLHIASQRTPGREAALISKPLSEWGGFRVTVDALALTPELAAETHGTLSSMPTRATPLNRVSTSGSGKSGGAIVAMLLYELLGGSPPARGTYAPLARLNETANHLLRDAMQGRQQDAAALLASLRRALGSEMNTPGPPSTRARTQHSTVPPSPRWLNVAQALAAIVVVLALGKSWLVWHGELKKRQDDQIKQNVAAAESDKRHLEEQKVAAVETNLANGLSLQKQGRLIEAESVYQSCVESYEHLLGPEHPMTVAAKRHLAAAQNDRKDASIADAASKLALDLRKLGSYSDAEPECRTALTIYERLYGPEHPRTLAARGELASVQQNKHTLEQADQACDHAFTLRKEGKYGEAAAECGKALAVYENVLGPGHKAAITARENLTKLERDVADQTKSMQDKISELESVKRRMEEKDRAQRLEDSQKLAQELEAKRKRAQYPGEWSGNFTDRTSSGEMENVRLNVVIDQNLQNATVAISGGYPFPGAVSLDSDRLTVNCLMHKEGMRDSHLQIIMKPSLVDTADATVSIQIERGDFHASPSFVLRREAKPFAAPAPTQPSPTANAWFPPTMKDRVESFVRNTVAVENTHNLDNIMLNYDDQAKYFDKGLVNHDFIREDKFDYFTKWPVAIHTIFGSIRWAQLSNGFVKVEFDTTFHNETGDRSKIVDSTCEHILVLKPQGDRLLIVDEKSEVGKISTQVGTSGYAKSNIKPSSRPSPAPPSSPSRGHEMSVEEFLRRAAQLENRPVK